MIMINILLRCNVVYRGRLSCPVSKIRMFRSYLSDVSKVSLHIFIIDEYNIYPPLMRYNHFHGIQWLDSAKNMCEHVRGDNVRDSIDDN